MRGGSLSRAIRCAALGACVAFFAFCAQASDVADADNYDRHDFSGVWVKPRGGRDPVTLALNAADTRPESTYYHTSLPLTDAGRAEFDSRKPTGGPRQVESEMSHNDPRDDGNPLGLYRALQYSGNGRYMQFIHSEGMVTQILSVDRVWRNIYTDGRPVPDYHPAGPFWYGWSVGGWVDGALVFTTVSLDERAWLDSWGTPISADARIEERWERTGPDEITFTMTVNDPTFYTQPWTSIPAVFVRQPEGIEPFEIITAPVDIQYYNEEILEPSSTEAETD